MMKEHTTMGAGALTVTIHDGEQTQTLRSATTVAAAKFLEMLAYQFSEQHEWRHGYVGSGQGGYHPTTRAWSGYSFVYGAPAGAFSREHGARLTITITSHDPAVDAGDWRLSGALHRAGQRVYTITRTAELRRAIAVAERRRDRLVTDLACVATALTAHEQELHRLTTNLSALLRHEPSTLDQSEPISTKPLTR